MPFGGFDSDPHFKGFKPPKNSSSVCLSRWWILSKRVIVGLSSNFFHRRVDTPIWFSVPNVIVIFRRGPPNGGVECRWDRHMSRFWTNRWLSIDTCCRANNKCDGGRWSLPHRAPLISESMFITTSMDDHDKEKRTKQNLIVRSRKPEAEFALDVLYCWSYWQTRSTARSLREQGHFSWYSGRCLLTARWTFSFYGV